MQVATLVTLSMDARRLRLRVGAWAVAMTLVASADRTCLSSILGLQPSKRRPFPSKTRGHLGSRYIYKYSTYASLNIYLNRCACNWAIYIYSSFVVCTIYIYTHHICMYINIIIYIRIYTRKSRLLICQFKKVYKYYGGRIKSY